MVVRRYPAKGQLAGFALAIVVAGRLDRILPPRLEPYRRPPWKADKFATLFPRDRVDSAKPKEEDQPGSEPPRNS